MNTAGEHRTSPLRFWCIWVQKGAIAMKITRCPDCSTGWLYAEDLPKRHHHNLSHDHGLVKCPTCNGHGRVLEPDDAPIVIRATVTASSIEPASAQFPVCELPISSAYQIAA